MKFTDFEVTRVGETVVLSCFNDAPPKGGKVQVTIECEKRELAEMYEEMFKRLCECATVYEEVPEDVLQATIQLMKGKSP
jgi:hypothetical protein